MPFYDLSKIERNKILEGIHKATLNAISKNDAGIVRQFADDNDTYIRKSFYLTIGKLFREGSAPLANLLQIIHHYISDPSAKCRQVAINAAGEIGKTDFESIKLIMEKGLSDSHSSVRNAVIGSVKKMSEVNPIPVFRWARVFLHHPDVEIRREICHGIELRGRKQPEDILPLLQELQHYQEPRIRKTLIHVVGQISYKKGCLEIVLDHLLHWENQELVQECIREIIIIHDRYKNFSHYSTHEAKEIILRYKCSGLSGD